jgi:hypothetical protein
MLFLWQAEKTILAVVSDTDNDLDFTIKYMKQLEKKLLQPTKELK